MGLGHCLMEHIVLDDTGRIRNLGALDYRVPTTKDVPHQLFAAMVETSVAPAAAGNEHRAERTWRTSECQCQLRLVGPGFDRARDLKLLPRNDCGWPGQAGAEQGCAHPGRGVARPRITDRSGVASVRST